MIDIDELFGENVSYLQDDFLERKKLKELQNNVDEARNHIEYAMRYFEDYPIYCEGIQLALDILNGHVI